MFMKAMHVKSLLVFVMLAAGAFARADVIVDNLGQPTQNYFGPIGDDSNKNDFLIGQEFTLPPGASPYQLNDITLSLSATGGGANITVSVWTAGTDNNPASEIAVVSSQYVANAGNVDFVPSTNIMLSPGIYYVVAAPATPADSGWVSWAYADSTNWTGSGMLYNIADTFHGDWENYSITNLPQQLGVEATPVTATPGISRFNGGIALSWPTNLFGYVVDAATNLASPDWQPITNVATSISGINTLTNSWHEPRQFFRLRQSYVAENLDQPQTDWAGPIGTDNNNNDFLIGQEFTLPAGNYQLNKITLALIPANGSASVTVSIWNVDPYDNPNNEIAVVSSQFISSAGNVDFVPTIPLTLPAGTYYVMTAPTTSVDNAKIGWYWTMSTTWTGFGSLGNLASTYYGLWENESNSVGPYQMSVQATPISGF
jgi:hypothetical protein